MDVANGRRCQPTPRFVDEDDVVTFSEARSQQRKVQFDTWSPRWATLTVTREHQIHLPYPSYVEEEDEFVDEEFQEDEFVDEKFKHEDVHDDVLNMNMLKILHKDSWIGTLHQPKISILMMKILWEALCHMIKRKNL
jgi:hypothetical protein